MALGEAGREPVLSSGGEFDDPCTLCKSLCTRFLAGFGEGVNSEQQNVGRLDARQVGIVSYCLQLAHRLGRTAISQQGERKRRYEKPALIAKRAGSRAVFEFGKCLLGVTSTQTRHRQDVRGDPVAAVAQALGGGREQGFSFRVPAAFGEKMGIGAWRHFVVREAAHGLFEGSKRLVVTAEVAQG